MTKQQEWSVWLPFPPSVNGLFRELSPERRAVIAAGMVRKGKKGRPPTRCISKAYKTWREQALLYLIEARSKGELPRQSFAQPVVVKLQLTPRDSRTRDADNYAKPVLDALVEARVLTDDSNRYVKAVIPYWENPDAASGVVVTIRVAKAARREALNAHERKMLARLRRDGSRLVSPGYSSNAIRSLVAKGYVRELPGLLEEIPQGYVPTD